MALSMNKNNTDIFSGSFEDTVMYCQSEGRICPKPHFWNEFWNGLPNKKRKENSWEPSVPLILASWWETTDKDKQDRFDVHIRYAFENGYGKKAQEYLMSLSEHDWHHIGE